ncbi:hypothetical protein D3C75_1015930 [compost metagenome]
MPQAGNGCESVENAKTGPGMACFYISMAWASHINMQQNAESSLSKTGAWIDEVTFAAVYAVFVRGQRLIAKHT